MSAAAVKSAMRAFKILELFDRHRCPLSLREITAELGYPASSGSALLKSLLTSGYLSYDHEQRTYMPTMRLSRIGHWAEAAFLNNVELLSAMAGLHDATGECTVLGTQSDLYAQYLHVIYGDEPVEVGLEPGLCRSLCHSGIGWALLAQKSDAEVDLLRRRINKQTGETVSREMLAERIAQVRDQGYSFSRHTVTHGAGMISMALPKEPRGPILALGVGGSVRDLERKEADIVSCMRETVATLSSQPSQISRTK